jgi:hypothetical protein
VAVLPGDSECAEDRLMKILREDGHPRLVKGGNGSPIDMAIRPRGGKTRNAYGRRSVSCLPACRESRSGSEGGIAGRRSSGGPRDARRPVS